MPPESIPLSETGSGQIFLILGLLGLTSHAFFIRYRDVDRPVGNFFLPYLAIQLGLGLCLWLFGNQKSIWSVTGFLCLANTSFFFPLFNSISIYRLFFHPLRSFPGPTLAKLTTWWGVFKIAAGANKYQLHHELHLRYGPIVRIAPNLLSVNRLDVLAACYGPGTKCGKSHTFYDFKDAKSLQTERDLKRHAARRPPWDKALSARNSTTYYPKMDSLLELLIKKITELADAPVLINHWMTCFTFDVMGQLAYDKSYGCLQTGVIHQGIIDMETAIATAVVIYPLPWLIRILSSIVGVPKHMKGFVRFAEIALAERKSKAETPDVLSYVLEGRVTLTPEELIEDTMMLQIAGSDTTNSTLIFCLFEIARSFDIQAALRQEILQSAGEAPDTLPIKLTLEMIKDLPLLGAVIEETLRLHPTVPGGLLRLVPPEGIHLSDGTYLPGNTSVSCPTWSIQNDPQNFSDPSTWNPYRWLDQPAVHNRKAFIPFSIGPFNCAGKHFAYMEMRATIAKLVTSFEIRLAPGEDGHRILYQSRDHVAIICAPVWLDMKPISRKA